LSAPTCRLAKSVDAPGRMSNTSGPHKRDRDEEGVGASPPLPHAHDFSGRPLASIGPRGKTNRLIDALKSEGAEYLARQLWWVFHNGEIDSFMLVCRDDETVAEEDDAAIGSADHSGGS